MENDNIGRFEIVIRNESGEGGSSSKEENGKKPGRVHNPVSATGKSIAKKLGTAMVVKHVVDEIAMHNHSLIEIRTGSAEAQQRATYTYGMISSFAGSAMSGAAAGAVIGGIPGAFVGALTGVVTNQAQRTISYVKNTERLEKSKTLENMTRNIAVQRETINGSRYMNATQM